MSNATALEYYANRAGYALAYRGQWIVLDSTNAVVCSGESRSEALALAAAIARMTTARRRRVA